MVDRKLQPHQPFHSLSSQEAVLLASQDLNEWPMLKALPSYGRGRDAAAGRYSSLIFRTNLTHVIVTGDNGTTDGQGEYWWQQFHRKKLKYTGPYLIEIMIVLICFFVKTSR